MRWLTGFALMALFSISLACAQNMPRPIFVDPAAFRCLLANLDQVPMERKGVFVDFRDCERGGIRIIRHIFAPQPPIDPTGNETILFVKPKQLACMKRNRKHEKRILQELPGNRHALRIDPCGG